MEIFLFCEAFCININSEKKSARYLSPEIECMVLISMHGIYIYAYFHAIIMFTLYLHVTLTFELTMLAVFDNLTYRGLNQ